MCGRFSVLVDYHAAKERYLASVRYEFRPSYNISPGQTIPAVIYEDGPVIEGLKWGLVPHWARDPGIGSRMINARSEGIQDKPSFRRAFRESRCLIPASGFFEWKKPDSVPYYFRLKDQNLFSFAGVWSAWKPPEGEPLRSCAIITTSPNSVVSGVHDRMPVILPRESEKDWIEPGTDQAALLAMLRPYPVSQMEGYRVSRQVNSSRENSPGLIRPEGPPGLQGFM